MCLSIVSSIKARRKYGYKVMTIEADQSLKSFVYPGRPFRLGRWYTDKPFLTTIQADCHEYWYPAGFHFWHRLADAKMYFGSGTRMTRGLLADEALVKVEVKDILASGIQYQYYEQPKPEKVSVAKKMKVIKIIKRR